jgi:two-component system sensor histidine kinase/response regulator
LLTANNFRVTTASNGKTALSIALNEQPDLILLDIMMPEMSGLAVLDILVKDKLTMDIPVLMVSAKSEAEDIEGALNMGAVDYIPKPFNDVELLARVRAALRLKKQKDKLKELMESKSNFIRVLAHDLRSPFSSIAGFAKVLLNDEDLVKKLTEEHKEFLHSIIDTSHYLFEYFNKLLDWSKIEVGKIELKKGSVKVSKLFDITQMVFQKNMEDKNIRLIREASDDIIVMADDTYLNQVINNLVSNAIKYSPEGGNIILKTYKDGNGIVVIEVSDNGAGIHNLTPEQLFNNPYHKTTLGTSNEKGSGLGLFICKMIIDAHGFDISFHSEPNKGTTFVILCKYRDH